jgi:DNA polymerase I
MRLEDFKHVWLVDSEFSDNEAAPRYEVHCVVFKNLRTKEVIRFWKPGRSCPIKFGQDSLMVAYFATAELKSFLSLGWLMPLHVLDLFAEFRVLTNGTALPEGNGLLGAMHYFGLAGGDKLEKEEMRAIAIRGWPFTEQEQVDLLDYCQSDVEALHRLLLRMNDKLDLGRALIRGRYMRALSRVELTGVPIDADALTYLRENWEPVKQKLIQSIDANFGVYDEEGKWRTSAFLDYITRHGIPWPLTETGNLKLDDDTFKSMSVIYPQLQPLRELRSSLSKFRLADLPVGADGWNRCLLSPFRSITGRNQPSTSKFIFGPDTWVRNLIRPKPGRALAYADWSQQEFGIPAALSHDKNMMGAYSSGDPYLQFAIQAGAAPPNATKKTHAEIRDQFKVAALAVQFGMSAVTLGSRLGKSSAHGRELLNLHKRIYAGYWRYVDCVANKIRFGFHHTLAMGWQVHNLPGLSAIQKPGTLTNFPIQGNGAEMMRLAVILATDRGVRICCPVHDALLIEDSIENIEHAVAVCQAAMEDASAVILNDPRTPDSQKFKLRSDAKIVRFPDHYSDPRGDAFWKKLRELLPRLPA